MSMRLFVLPFLIAACGAPVSGPSDPTGMGPPLPSTAPTPMVAGAPPSARMQTPVAAPRCEASLDRRPSGRLALVLADGEREGTAVLVELGVPGRVVGRIRLGYQPVVAVDAINHQVLAVCSPRDGATPTELAAYSLDDLGVRWSVPLAERILTKVTAAPSVLPSVDGRYVFTYHYRTLRPGDGHAPGNTRYWVAVRDARTGSLLREVETPQCGVSLFHQATPDLLYLGCSLGGHVRALRTDTWQEAVYFVTSAPRLAALTATGDRYVIATHDQWILTYDATTGRQLSRSHWTDTATPTVPFFGRLAMSGDGSEVWLPTAPPSYEARPGRAIAQIDLRSAKRVEHPVAELGTVMNVHGRVVYVDGGRLAALGQSERLDLGVAHRAVAWTIVAIQ
jgi:hypothetical protein